jgi:dTMP kinase
MPQGLFLTFEGIEGCGKTIQATLLVQYLKSRNIPVLHTREPGGTPIGDQIRKILLNPENHAMTGLTELLLYSASRAQHVQQIIRPSLEKGLFVVCDRYTDATLAYQGAGRVLDWKTIQTLNQIATSELCPDLTILLDVPVELGLERARNRNLKMDSRNQEGRFEEEDLAFHTRVREGYIQLATREPDRIRIIDGTQEVEAIHEEIIKIVFLRIRCRSRQS